jgi:hypothetical protein
MPRHANTTEVVSKRTRAAKHFENPDGTFTAELSPDAHYWDGISWKDNRPGFVAGAGSNEWVSANSGVTMRTYGVGRDRNRWWWVDVIAMRDESPIAARSAMVERPSRLQPYAPLLVQSGRAPSTAAVILPSRQHSRETTGASAASAPDGSGPLGVEVPDQGQQVPGVHLIRF